MKWKIENDTDFALSWNMGKNSLNKQILNLAIPNVISNISIPLLGMVDIAIVGWIGSDTYIGALAIGATIFNFIYWNFSFLRMGTSGMTAQAYGADNKKECANLLVRALILALVSALLLLILRKPIGELAFKAMKGNETVMALTAKYFYVRILAAPAAVSIFAFNGWFIGMQDSKTPMWIALIANAANLGFCSFFVFVLDMGISGVAWGTVLAQYIGLILSIIVGVTRYKKWLRYIDWKECFQLQPLLHFLNINKDVFLRTACVVVAYSFFTAASSRFGETVLATNTLLMQLFTLYSYMTDGFGYSAEALSGRFIGEKNEIALRRCIKSLYTWCVSISLIFALLFMFGWKMLLHIFNPSIELIQCAQHYIGWVVAVPLISFMPFLMDGIMLGATKTKVLRNTVFISTLIYFACFYGLVDILKNDALWLAFILFILTRGILLFIATKNLNVGYLMSDKNFLRR